MGDLLGRYPHTMLMLAFGAVAIPMAWALSFLPAERIGYAVFIVVVGALVLFGVETWELRRGR